MRSSLFTVISFPLTIPVFGLNKSYGIFS
jgi:hypothetical protein